ncbi:MAG: DUF3486 family protein [Desulfobacteraceae bacterium]|nr:DUF3486 family protein [Desulfobacteraceae bacterium]
MPKPSTIEILPPEIKAQLQAWLQDPRITQLEATERANSLLELAGHPERVTKSAVNRYAVRMEEVGAKLRQSREVAQMYIAQVGAAPQGQSGLLINEMLRSMAFEVSLKMQEADAGDPESMAATINQLKNLALTMQRLEQSATINVKRENEIKRQALEEATKTMEATAKSEGVTAETIQRIRRDVLMMAG